MSDEEVKEFLRVIVKEFTISNSKAMCSGGAILNFLERNDAKGKVLAEKWMDAGYDLAVYLKSRGM